MALAGVAGRTAFLRGPGDEAEAWRQTNEGKEAGEAREEGHGGANET